MLRVVRILVINQDIFGAGHPLEKSWKIVRDNHMHTLLALLRKIVGHSERRTDRVAIGREMGRQYKFFAFFKVAAKAMHRVFV